MLTRAALAGALIAVSAASAAAQGQSSQMPGTAPAPVVPSDEPVFDRIRFQSANLRTGARIHWAESGDTAGAAVILLHGYSDSWFSWSPVLPLLPADVRAIAVDMRGHGNSGDEPGDFTIGALASDVVALMDHLGITRATIVGHSLGSLVAQAVTAENGHRVDRLALIGAISHGALRAMNELRQEVLTLPDPVPVQFIRDFQESTFADPQPGPFLDRVIEESGKLSAAAWHGLANGWTDADYRKQLGRLGKPTLLLWGDRDAYFTRDVQQSLLDHIPGARLITFENTGHATHWEQPQRVADELVRFMR